MPAHLKSFYLRLSITDRCNLRCVYCLPEQARFAAHHAQASELMRLSELISEVAPIHKIRVTGGEPTLCRDLLAHVRHAHDLAGDVGLTSNGILLEPLLPELKASGLTRVNISLDALDADGFRRASRREGLPAVISAIRAAKRLGFSRVKVNAVAMSDTDFVSLSRFAAWEGIHLRFIELMAIGEARTMGHCAISSEEMRSRIRGAGINLVQKCDHDEPTSRVYAIDDQDVEECSVGFITTVSAPFCSTCNRIRLSSQGRLFTCLMDNQGTDLLTPLRNGDESAVRQFIGEALRAKRPPLTFIRNEAMASIGG